MFTLLGMVFFLILALPEQSSFEDFVFIYRVCSFYTARWHVSHDPREPGFKFSFVKTIFDSYVKVTNVLDSIDSS